MDWLVGSVNGWADRARVDGQRRWTDKWKVR